MRRNCVLLTLLYEWLSPKGLCQNTKALNNSINNPINPSSLPASLFSRSLQQLCNGSAQQMLASSPTLSSTPPMHQHQQQQQQHHAVFTSVLNSLSSNGSPTPPSATASSPSTVTSNANIIFSTDASSPSQPAFVQVSMPEVSDDQLLR